MQDPSATYPAPLISGYPLINKGEDYGFKKQIDNRKSNDYIRDREKV